MRRRTTISLIAACAISACAHQNTPPAAAALDGMRWIEVEGDDPKLAFGVPDSDVMVLMMTCAPRSGQVALAIFGGDGREVRLRSGSASSRLSAREGGTALHENIIETALPAGAPVLASFARTGDLAVGTKGTTTSLPRAEPAQAQKFVSACR
jgi:hypothetical protein